MARLEGIAAAILAGGLATRMGGRAKGLLLVEGRCIIDRQLEVLDDVFDEVLIVANDPAPYEGLGRRLVSDPIPGQGPLGGILAALEAALAEQVVVVACDMPHLQAETLRLVADPGASEQVVVPVVAGRPEPLHARYARSCAPRIRELLGRGERKTARLLDLVSCRRLDEGRLRALDPTLRFLTNCNVPHDLP